MLYHATISIRHFSYYIFFKVANDVVNGTGKVICMKGQSRKRLKLFSPLVVLAIVQFCHVNLQLLVIA